MNQTKLIACCVLLMSGVVSHACKKNKLKGTDEELLELAKNTDGFVWYKNNSALLPKSSGSGHPQPLLRTRYNAVAATKLDSLGKIQNGALFADGSLIVKELFESESKLKRYAILYKNSGSPDADSKGWVWGYVDADGKVIESASKKGSACTGCHLQSNNIDYMLMNKFYP
jgi:hypothetical protein